jgi:hypothetical protein
VELSEDEANVVRARFNNGETNDLPVASAEMTVLEIRRELTNNHGRLHTALAALYKALGDDSHEQTAEKQCSSYLRVATSTSTQWPGRGSLDVILLAKYCTFNGPTGHLNYSNWEATSTARKWPVVESANALDQATHHIADTHSIGVPRLHFAQYGFAAPAQGAHRIGEGQNFQT